MATPTTTGGGKAVSKANVKAAVARTKDTSQAHQDAHNAYTDDFHAHMRTIKGVLKRAHQSGKKLSKYKKQSMLGTAKGTLQQAKDSEKEGRRAKNKEFWHDMTHGHGRSI